MNKGLYIGVELLHGLQHFLFFYAMSVAVQSMVKGEAVNYVMPLWILGYLLITQVLRRKIHIFPMVLVMQVVMAALVVIYLSTNTSGLVANVIALVILFILTMWARRNPWGYAIAPISILAALFYPVYYMMARHYEHYADGRRIAGMCLLFLVASYVERYFSNLNQYIKEDRSISRMDIHKLITVNAGVLAVFLAVVLFGAAVFLKILPLDPLWNFLAAAFVFLAKVLAHLVIALAKGSKLEDSVTPQLEQMDQIPINSPGNNTIAKVILGLIVLYYVIRFLIRLYQHLKNATAAPEDIVIYAEPKEIEEKVRKKLRRTERFGGGNAKKVRRLYKRLVKSHRRTCMVLKSSHTAQAISANMEREDCEYKGQQRDYRQVTALYEKARYSKETIADDEVHWMKERVK